MCRKLHDITKIVARHLTPLLPQLIHPFQTGFIRNRSILDNLFSFQEAIALAKYTNNKVVVVLLDFKKAYDRVCQKFLEIVMGKLGFQESWIKGIARLYRNANNCVSLASEYRGLYERDAHWVHPYFYYMPKHSLPFSTRGMYTYVVFPCRILTKAS